MKHTSCHRYHRSTPKVSPQGVRNVDKSTCRCRCRPRPGWGKSKSINGLSPDSGPNTTSTTTHPGGCAIRRIYSKAAALSQATDSRCSDSKLIKMSFSCFNIFNLPVGSLVGRSERNGSPNRRTVVVFGTFRASSEDIGSNNANTMYITLNDDEKDGAQWLRFKKSRRKVRILNILLFVVIKSVLEHD